MKDPTEAFLDLVPRAPGSKKPTLAAQRAQQREDPEPREVKWDDRPKFEYVNGVEMEFFDIGALALALNRRPATIRAWEAEGIIPKAQYIKGKGTGKRRLYTRAQILGMRTIAEEEGLLQPLPSPNHRQEYFKPIKDTRFKIRVLQLFIDLQRQEQQ